MTEEKQIVHDSDQPAKQDRAETGHRTDKNGDDRKDEQVHRTLGGIGPRRNPKRISNICYVSGCDGFQGTALRTYARAASMMAPDSAG